MKRRADLSWLVVFSVVAQLVLGSPQPVTETPSHSTAVVQPVLGLDDLSVVAPSATLPAFPLPAHMLFPIAGMPGGQRLTSAEALPNALMAANVDRFLWALPQASSSDGPADPETSTDEAGRYRFVGLPRAPTR